MEPIEVEVRGVKARIYGAASNPGCAWIADRGLRALNKQGEWTPATVLLSGETMWPSPADAQAFVDRLNAEWEREKAIPGPCSYCGSPDHWRPDCPQIPKDRPPASQPPQGEQPQEMVDDLRRAYRANDDVLFYQALTSLTRQLAETRQEVERLKAENESAREDWERRCGCRECLAWIEAHPLDLSAPPADALAFVAKLNRPPPEQPPAAPAAGVRVDREFDRWEEEHDPASFYRRKSTDLTRQLAEARQEVDRLKEALSVKPGGCRMLSRGDVCDCTLCRQSKQFRELLKEKDDLLTAAQAALKAAEELAENGIGEAEANRLAAISTAALANTPVTAAAARIANDHPCWTAAYEDVFSAVQREIRERERAEAAERERDQLQAEVEKLRSQVVHGPAELWELIIGDNDRLEQPQEMVDDLRRAYRANDDVLFYQALTSLTRQLAETRQEVERLTKERDAAERRADASANEIQAIIAPAEVGGGIVAHLKNQLTDSRKDVERLREVADSRGRSIDVLNEANRLGEQQLTAAQAAHGTASQLVSYASSELHRLLGYEPSAASLSTLFTKLEERLTAAQAALKAAEERAEFLDRAWQQCNEARESAERELATVRQQLAELQNKAAP